MDIGESVPDLQLQGDGAVALSSFRGKWLVLFFYPKDFTPGCTAEVCAFRDAYQDFQDAGAHVVGVSRDGGGSHEKFSSKHDLPFPLLSDPGGRVAKQLGVKNSLAIIPGRETFVVDPKGVLRHRFRSQSQATKHVEEALAVITQ